MSKKTKLYLVTDSEILEKRDFYKCIEEALKGGAEIIQLREKDCLGKEFLEKAIKIRELTKKYNALFIVNDRVDIAIISNADGVHIGQSDIPAKYVRSLIGKEMILGVSARNLEEALKAQKDGADYIGVGAMFNTSTKLDAEYVTKEELLKIKKETNIPIVAIGGLTLENIESLKEFQLNAYAVISAILNKNDIYSECKKWINKM